MTFKVISFFSGCGGSSLGYQLAGGKVLLAVEMDANAAQTYSANFPLTSIFHGDIANLSVSQVLEITNILPGQLDIFDGSPPCQGFSTNGKRDFKDSRNQLFKEYCRILEGLKPKVFVMENVSGMIKGNMKFIFAEIIKTLKSCGYNVKAKLLNAKNYNVAQSRERLIFIGTRNDLNIEPSFPIPTPNIMTVRQALKDCPDGKRLPVTGFPLSVITKMKQGESAGDYHPKRSYFSNIRISWDKPCPTITKQCSRGILYHPEIHASLSIEEIKRLSSFPDTFKFFGEFQDQWAIIGNCVPPNLMKKIAENIKENILNKIQG